MAEETQESKWSNLALLRLSAFGFGTNGVGLTMDVIILPALTLFLVADELKNTYLGFLGVGGLIVAALVQLSIASLSDRTRSPLGKRLPYLLWGCAFLCIGLVGLGLAPNYAILFVAWMFIQGSINIGYGPYQALIQEDPELESYLDRLPGSVFSSRIRESGGLKSGVFFCYSLPALDSETGSFTEVAGTTRWYLYDRTTGEIVEEPSTIVGNVRSDRDTPRSTVTDEEWLKEIRTSIEKHIRNTYLKRVDAPVGVKPALKCWMEIKEG
ncbi:MAG: hypothetical protein IIC99_05900 [Chloroflexi bacterium]|nr:hypothetical protein [Chloroflexota bacterium]